MPSGIKRERPYRAAGFDPAGDARVHRGCGPVYPVAREGAQRPSRLVGELRRGCAGVTIATGIVSALRNIPVRHDIAMTGEITIMGKVLAVGGIQGKLLAAIEAGVKTVILPADNEQDVRFLPQYMRDRVELVYVRDIQEALTAALTLPPARS
jgi:hypothetical protein